MRICISSLNLLQVFSVSLRQWEKVSSFSAAGSGQQSMTQNVSDRKIDTGNNGEPLQLGQAAGLSVIWKTSIYPLKKDL